MTGSRKQIVQNDAIAPRVNFKIIEAAVLNFWRQLEVKHNIVELLIRRNNFSVLEAADLWNCLVGVVGHQNGLNRKISNNYTLLVQVFYALG